MSIVVKRSGGDFVPCPAGTWPAVCVDVIDLGEVRNEWKGEMVHKVRLVWQVAERMPDGRPYIVSRMYTASLHEKSSLRKDLSSWRGMDFRPEELTGFDLENVLGVGCLLSVMQQAGNDGQTYANVIAVMRLPNGYEAPAPDGYVRTIHRQPDGGGLVSQPRQQQPPYRQQPPPPFAPRQMAPRAPQPPQPPSVPSGWPQQQPPPPYPPEQQQVVNDDDVPF